MRHLKGDTNWQFCCHTFALPRSKKKPATVLVFQALAVAVVDLLGVNPHEVVNRTCSLTTLQRAMGHADLKTALGHQRNLEAPMLKAEDIPWFYWKLNPVWSKTLYSREYPGKSNILDKFITAQILLENDDFAYPRCKHFDVMPIARRAH